MRYHCGKFGIVQLIDDFMCTVNCIFAIFFPFLVKFETFGKSLGRNFNIAPENPSLPCTRGRGPGSEGEEEEEGNNLLIGNKLYAWSSPTLDFFVFPPAAAGMREEKTIPRVLSEKNFHYFLLFPYLAGSKNCLGVQRN